MADAPVTVDVTQPRDVLRQLAAKLSLDYIILIEQSGDPRDFVLVQLAGLGMWIDSGLMAHLPRYAWADTV